MASDLLKTSTSSMIKSIVENVITTKINRFAEEEGIPFKSLQIPKGKHFEEYLNRMYEKYSIINTLVFHNSQRLLKDIYVAQTLKKENRFEDEKEATRIDGMPKDLITKYKKILITDTAGMGKSTITKRMFIDLIDNGIEGVGVPIYIELNRLNKDRSIIREIQDGLSLSSEIFNHDLLLKFIRTGGFIFFLDGYDEILNADRREVTKDIQSFISKAGTKNYYILTSRPEDSLSSFGDFQSFRIQPLDKEEAFELLSKYDLSKNKELSGKLIELLKSGQYDTIDEYLENPLLVSLLFAAFDHKQTIPLKKHLFYRQVYEAYFDSHDLSKGIDAHQKRSGLDIHDFNRILRYVGYECLIRIGVQFDQDTILNSIDRAKAFCGDLGFTCNAFLKDLMTSVPLFSKDGLEYKWAHKSLMEYFAARFIAEDAKENQDKILTAIYESKNFTKYLNVLDIYYDIDPKGFSKNITLPFCEQYIDICNSSFASININKHLIEDRVSCLLTTKCAFVISSNRSEARNLFHRAGRELGMYASLNIQTVHNVKVYFAVGEASKNFILRRLFSRKKSSFYAISSNARKKDNKLRAVGLPKEMGQFEHDKVHVIDVNTGDNSDELYNKINLSLFDILGPRYYDYENFKKEVERIRKEINQSKNATALLDGI